MRIAPRAPNKAATALVLLALACTWAGPARAQSPTADEAPAPPPRTTPIGISGSLTNALAIRGAASESTLMTILGASYSWTGAFSTFARVGSVYNASTGLGRTTELANPALGVTFQLDAAKNLTIGGQLGTTIPVGSGGGNSASPASIRGWMNSIDWGGVMFAPNHVTLFGGLRAAYTLDRFSFQLESVLYELLRVRGEETDPVGAAATLTGTTATVSYELLPRLSLSTAISETRVWNTPTYVAQDRDSRVDYFFIAGASTAVNVGGTDVSPGLLYARALDLPLSGQGFQVAELDLGFSL